MKKELHYEELLKWYNELGNITKAVRKVCENNKIKFTDSLRRLGSSWLNTEGAIIKNHNAKILVFDIETSPMLGYVWGLWQQNVHPTNGQLIQDWFMLTWSAKWLFEDRVLSDKLKPKEVRKQDDSRIVKSLWDLFEEADIVIAHNAKKFDIKRLQTRMLKNGLGPNSPYQVIDTLTHAKRQFNISSNKLDYIANFLGLVGKMETGGFDLWKKCMEGDKESLLKMELYNIQDVKVLEEVYLHLRPYIKPHPNVGLFIQTTEECCSHCGSTDLKPAGQYATYVNTYDALRCGECGSVNRRRKSNLDKEQKRNLLRS